VHPVVFLSVVNDEMVLLVVMKKLEMKRQDHSEYMLGGTVTREFNSTSGGTRMGLKEMACKKVH
jgi:hypothetical protein